nr:LysE family translocator [Bradyrhizobium sp. 179]
MFELQTFALFLAAATVVAVTPGPGIFYIVARTLPGGRTEGSASSVGLGLSGFVHLGPGDGERGSVHCAEDRRRALSHLARHQDLEGSASPRAGRSPDDGAGRALREGIVVEALNPKTVAFFLAFIPQFVDTSVNVAL